MGNVVLKVSGLSKSFGETTIFKNLDFELREREMLGLMGLSGSGKSVLLKLIIGLIAPDEGEVWFKGTELTSLSERELSRIRSRIGYVFQEGALFDSLTIEENLSYPLRKHTAMSDGQMHEIVNERLRLVGLGGTNERYPGEISGGMRRRVGLLRATMLAPHLVLFDEPTSGLDPITIENFIVQISRVRRDFGISGIFVTHDPAAALAVCDRVGFLWKGKLKQVPIHEIGSSSDPLVQSFFRMHYGGESDEQAP